MSPDSQSLPTSGTSPSQSAADEELWDELLQLIEKGRVVPIVGRDLLTVDIDGQRVLLYRWLARQLADALGMAQGGSLAGRPAELVRKALSISATHPRALEMAGSAAYEAGDYAGALAYWEGLLAQLPEGSGAHSDLAAAITRTRALRAAPG